MGRGGGVSNKHCLLTFFIFHAFCGLQIFFKMNFSKNSSVNTITVSNSLHQQTTKLSGKELEKGVQSCVLVVNFSGNFSYKNCLDWCHHI